MIFETLIHAFTLLYHICDQNLDFSIKKIDWKKSAELYTTGAFIEGNYQNCNFKLKVDKKTKKNRFVFLKYSNGKIYLNIENKECKITLNTGDSIKLSVKEKYMKNYTVQVHLIDKFIQNHAQWQSVRFDDYPNQVILLLYIFENIYKKWLEEN